MNPRRLALFSLCLFAPALVMAKTPCNTATVFQIKDRADLLTGPKADGRVGDFKLCNSKISVVVEGARYSNGYHPYGGMVVDLTPTQGNVADLYDKAFPLISSGGNIFGLRTLEAKSVKAVQGQGEARLVVETVDSPFPVIESYFNRNIPPHGFSITIEYVLKDGESELRTILKPRHQKKGMALVGIGMGFFAGDGLNLLAPQYGYSTHQMVHNKVSYLAATTSGVSYAWVAPKRSFTPIFPYNTSIFGGYQDLQVPAGGGKEFVLYTLVGQGGLEEIRQRAETLRFGQPPAAAAPVTARVMRAKGSLGDCAGVPVYVLKKEGGAESFFSMARLAKNCEARLLLPAGEWRVVAAEKGIGAWGDSVLKTDGVTAAGMTLQRPPTGYLRVTPMEKGKTGPQPAVYTVAPQFAWPDLPAAVGMGTLVNSYADIVPQGIAAKNLLLRTGDYTVRINRGYAYGVTSSSVKIPPGQTVKHAPVIARAFDHPGWQSADLHMHFMPSMDSDHTIEDGLLAAHGHGLDIAVATDHNIVTDPAPAIRRLGIGKDMLGVTGIEMTTYSTGHFNIFPLRFKQDGLNHGWDIPNWHLLIVPELFERMRKLHGEDILVQINHARGGKGGFFDGAKLDPETGVPRDKKLFPDNLRFDLMELLNGPHRDRMGQLLRDWANFMNQGRRVVMTGVSDSHEYISMDTAFCRTYVLTGKTKLSQVTMKDFTTALRGGRAVVSCGQFMDMLALKNGKLAGRLGDTVSAKDGKAQVKITIKAADWIGAEKLDILVNGRVPVKTIEIPQGKGPVNFTTTVDLKLDRDSYVYAVATSHKPLSPYYFGEATAITNPIFFDVNGDGKWTAK